MTKYEISQYLRELLDGDCEDLVMDILTLAEHLEDDEEKYFYRGQRVDNGEWVEGCVIFMNGDYGEYRIATSCLTGDDPNLFTVCAYEVDPDTIEEVYE